ncbi:photosynthetic NDH subunit of subcomplex B 5, chloroplastic [Carya illinoinensis]|uniref:Photosynthetic NDH subunit of subcomplex B 5, chloroplastic n=2 Tax=Carya illinoinensis TaxID=32201 RepID=A0A922K6K9_CARIL|nr:photosynthetic NDH subunit of subcomplex B 5, chloroplastic [Carya illinoinensis]KAG6732740.1 hypothetical protein I3842_01G192700 [Carya illinoinensis]KAG6732741.1 hypothetical protein I3842_01G192700 [Carya illinoinensis]
MAVCSSSLPVFSAVSTPKLSSDSFVRTGIRVSNLNTLVTMPSSFYRNPGKNRRSTKLNRAGLSEIEPDLNEDPVDRWGINSVDPDDFKYGVYDGHHTYHEGEEKGTFWGAIAEDIAAVEPPTGFQGLISWLFLPAIATGMFMHVPMVYLFIGTGLFVTVFTIIEMDKPDKPHNFEPQIYNMDRGSRDKLIADYNTMSIWDFNEKYGDLWDFTVKKDDITKR